MIWLARIFFLFLFAALLLLSFGCLGQNSAPASPLTLPKEYELDDYDESSVANYYAYNYGPSYSGRYTKYDRWDADMVVISSQSRAINVQIMFEEALEDTANKVYSKASYKKQIGSFNSEIFEANFSTNQTYGDFTGTLDAFGLSSQVNATMRVYHVDNGCSTLTASVFSYQTKEGGPNYVYSLAPEIENAIANAKLPTDCGKQLIAVTPKPVQYGLPASDGTEDPPLGS